MIFTVRATPYSFDVVFALGETRDAAFSYVVRHKLATAEDISMCLPAKPGKGETVWSQGNWVVLRVESPMTSRDAFNTLAHELFHTTMFVLTASGVRYTRGSEEAFAYLHGHLFEEVAHRTKLRML